MNARADKYTQTQKKPELFSDFLDSFAKHPVSNSLARVTNEDSIKQALKNIVKTQLGERPYKPFVGSIVARSNFELMSIFTQESLIESLKDSIKYSEPRVTVQSIVTTLRPEDHAVEVTIYFYAINNPVLLSVTILKRIR